MIAEFFFEIIQISLKLFFERLGVDFGQSLPFFNSITHLNTDPIESTCGQETD